MPFAKNKDAFERVKSMICSQISRGSNMTLFFANGIKTQLNIANLYL